MHIECEKEKGMSELIVPLWFAAIIFGMIAFFYSSVGLGGGSSYTALLAILGASTQAIPVISLSLNILVTSVGAFCFVYKGHGRLRLITPFLMTSIPMAYLGGLLNIPKGLFYFILLVSLVIAAWKIYVPSQKRTLQLGKPCKTMLSLLTGALLGLVAGIVGIGGGIYLVPLIILLGLGTEKQAAACGAIFVWTNSVAGLAARFTGGEIHILTEYGFLFTTVLSGGTLGALLGSGKFSARTMQKVLGSILVVAIVFMSKKMISLYWA